MDKGKQISGTILGVRVGTSSDSETTESAASSSCCCSFSCSWKEMGAELANLVKYKDAVISQVLVQHRHPIPTGLEMCGTKRKGRCSNKNNAKLMDLDINILIDIILRLPATSVCCLRSVSKLLKNMVDNPAFVIMYTQRLLTATNNAAEVPQLMLLVKSSLTGCFYNFKPLCLLDYNVNENVLKLRNRGIASEILTSHNNRYNVHFVFCNLVCFKDIKYGGRCFLFNPLKGEVLMLPTSNVQVPAAPSYRRGLAFSDWYAMGFDNITNTYKILRVCGKQQQQQQQSLFPLSGVGYMNLRTPFRVCGKPVPKTLVAQILVLGTSTWREISSVPPCEGLSHKNVSAYGDMHWVISWGTRLTAMGETSNIISFDFKKEEFYWIPHPPLRSNGFCLTYLNLLNLRGSLAIVDAWSDMHIDIWVLKNFNNKEWVKQYCINTELARYLRCCACPMDRCGEWEHGIFFKELISCREPQNNSTAIFLDLRGSTVSTKLVECPMLVQNWTIISYTGSLISLNNYGNLKRKQLGVDARLWQID